MSATRIVIVALLTAGVAAQLLLCVGLLVRRDAYDRLHLVGPANVIGLVLLVPAVALDSSSPSHTIRAVVAGLFLVVTGPFVTRAIARALRARQAGGFRIEADELPAAREEET